MIKIFHSILIIIFFLMSIITKSNASDISTILRNQQLTVFDIGIFRLQEDLKSSYPEIKKHKDVPYEDIYIDVLSSYWRNTVDLIVSIPVNENLKKENYMSDSLRCRNIFNSVRDHLLRNENMSNYRFTMATSYLTSIFSTPSSWPRWSYDQSVLEELVNLVKLEVILRPTTELAFKDNVNPVSCKGGLETENNEIIISMKYN
mgnify:FL=1